MTEYERGLLKRHSASRARMGRLLPLCERLCGQYFKDNIDQIEITWNWWNTPFTAQNSNQKIERIKKSLHIMGKDQKPIFKCVNFDPSNSSTLKSNIILCRILIHGLWETTVRKHRSILHQQMLIHSFQCKEQYIHIYQKDTKLFLASLSLSSSKMNRYWQLEKCPHINFSFWNHKGVFQAKDVHPYQHLWWCGCVLAHCNFGIMVVKAPLMLECLGFGATYTAFQPTMFSRTSLHSRTILKTYNSGAIVRVQVLEY